MTYVQAAEKVDGKVLVNGKDGDIIKQVYAGDFLSRVMGNAPADSVWVTVMANINVAGVAVLADIKAIVLCEGVQPDELLKNKCIEEEIALIVTEKSCYECCKSL